MPLLGDVRLEMPALAARRLVRTRWLVTAAMLALLAALTVEALLGPGVPGGEWLGRGGDDVVLVSAAALCFVRMLAEPRERLAWLLIWAGMLGWAWGPIYQSVALWHRAVPLVNPADVGWVLFYPLFAAGLLALARRQLGRLDVRLWIDSLIGALALTAFAAASVLGRIGASPDLVGAAISFGYPVGDLLLIAISVAIGSAAHWRLDFFWLVLVAGLVVTAAADAIYAGQVADGVFEAGTGLDVVWATGAALIGLASWIPAPRRLERLGGATAIGFPIVLAFGALAIVVYSSVDEVGTAAVLLAAGSVCASLVRLAMDHRDNAALLTEADGHAHVDALTGLGNRRAFAREMARLMLTPGSQRSVRLTLFDLDGFKRYNDAHGHPAGDDLLARLSQRLLRAVGSEGRCFRLGGDEFCLLAEVSPGAIDTLPARAATALSDPRPQSLLGCSHGSVLVPDEGRTVEQALQLADERMYEDKRVNRQRGAGGLKGPAIAPEVHLEPEGDRLAVARRGPAEPVHLMRAVDDRRVEHYGMLVDGRE